jgi:mono/diheme cytochrome c family protein
MTTAATLTENVEPAGAAAGLLAQFDGPASLLAAAAWIRREGFTRWDTYSPFPVHGMDRAMGIRPTRLPWLVLLAGIGGAAAALLLQWWTNAIDYPLVISGKPLFSLPANIPITFELIVLFSALAAFGGALVFNRLPQFWRPAFDSARFGRATSDGFFLYVEAADRKFDEAALRGLVQSLGATSIETCFDTAAGRSFPRPTVWIVLVALALATLPPLWIARLRLVKSATPRLDIFSDMNFQPKYKAQAASPLFADGRAMRPPLPGTVSQGGLEADDHFYRGMSDGKLAATFPMRPTRALMERGRQRFNIYCATCHGLLGAGDGMISIRAMKRGEGTWTPPVSLQSATIRDEPVGQIFNTITNGVRKMPSYAAQIVPEDRWAIVLYLRALQRSQNVTLDDVPEDLRSQLR